MHEMSLCMSVIEIIEAEALRQGFSRVNVVRLEIGALAHVDPDAMAFAFDAARLGSVAADAKLEIERPPGMAWCIDCEKPVTIAARLDPCPHCGGHRLKMTGGDELKIKDLEVD